MEGNIWNDSIEQTVKNIGESAKGYKIMHLNSATRNEKIHNRLMYTGIIIGPLSGVISGLGVILPAYSTVFLLIASVISFLSGIVITVVKYGKFENKSEAYKTAAAQYTSLESNTRRQLQRFRNNREPPDIYLEWISNKYEELFMGSPLIPSEVRKNYIEYATQHHLVIPDDYDITINIDETYIDNVTSELMNDEEITINKNINKDYMAINMENNKTRIKGKAPFKRTTTFTPFPDLEKFSDGQMAYELNRLMGFK